jgi:hypothetical protein
MMPPMAIMGRRSWGEAITVENKNVRSIIV